MSKNHKYKVRYLIDADWNKEVPDREQGKRVAPGIRPSRGPWGYADDVLLMSIMRNKDGEVESVLFVDTSTMSIHPSRRILVEAYAAIGHYLEKHCQEEGTGHDAARGSNQPTVEDADARPEEANPQ